MKNKFFLFRHRYFYSPFLPSSSISLCRKEFYSHQTWTFIFTFNFVWMKINARICASAQRNTKSAIILIMSWWLKWKIFSRMCYWPFYGSSLRGDQISKESWLHSHSRWHEHNHQLSGKKAFEWIETHDDKISHNRITSSIIHNTISPFDRN